MWGAFEVLVVFVAILFGICLGGLLFGEPSADSELDAELDALRAADRLAAAADQAREDMATAVDHRQTSFLDETA